MSIPKIDPYPPAPTPEDDEATFDEKAYEHAASLEVRRVQMNEVATYVNTRASDANNRAVAAAASATASANSATRSDEWANKAPGSVVASGKYSARHYSDLSDKFANAPEDVEVEPGKYSAQHYMEKAKKIADVHATTVETDPLPTVMATNVQEALRDLAYQADQLRVAKNKALYGDGPYPVLDLQFQGAKYLDPRIQFTRESKDWDWDGNEYGINEPVLTDKGLWAHNARTNLVSESSLLERTPLNAEFVPEREIVKGVIRLGFLRESFGDLLPHYVSTSNISRTSGESYRESFFVGKGSTRQVYVFSSASFWGSNTSLRFDPTTASILQPTNVTNPTVEDFGFAWRISFTVNAVGDGSQGWRIYLHDGESFAYTGDGESGAFVGSFQSEVGVTTTPYIPTEGSQVTVATAYTSLKPISDTWEYNKKGSFVCKVLGRNTGVASALIEFGRSTENNSIQHVYFSASTKAGFLSNFDSSNSVIPSINFDFPITFGLQWDETSVSAYVDGVKVHTVPWVGKASNPTLELFRRFTFIPYALLFDKTLSDEEMETLTS